jgi:hypothetical protein
VLAPGTSPAVISNVVALGTMRNGDPPIVVVLPWRPAGASERGIVVGPPMTTPPGATDPEIGCTVVVTSPAPGEPGVLTGFAGCEPTASPELEPGCEGFEGGVGAACVAGGAGTPWLRLELGGCGDTSVTGGGGFGAVELGAADADSDGDGEVGGEVSELGGLLTVTTGATVT